MAKLLEEILVVKVSKLVRDSEDPRELVSEEFIRNLEAVAGEIASDNVVVEIIRADDA